MKFNLIIFIAVTFYADQAHSQAPLDKIINQVYVIDREGIDIKQSPDPYSETISRAPYGAQLDVIKIYKYWFEIAVPKTDKLGYVKKSVVTSDVMKIPLTDSDLAEYPNFELKLISKKRFDGMRKTAINYFVADTNVIKKHKRTIRLPLKKGYKLLVDQSDYNKIDSNINSYIGQYPLLNKYVIINCDGEAEECSYDFVDKTTGETGDWSFGDFPYLSINKKYILSIHNNIYENYSELWVEKLTGNSIRQYANGEYKSLLPTEGHEGFWGSDGCFYLPVIPSIGSNLLLNKKKPPVYDYRYVRIKIKGPTITK